MDIQKFQHACIVVKTKTASLVIDPGIYTRDLIVPRRVDAIIITHEHTDHMDEKLIGRILKKHPKAIIVGHPQAVAPFTKYQTLAVQAGEQATIAETTLRFFGGAHAPIANSLQTPPNLGVLIDSTLYYPGDSFAAPGVPVKVLALPVSAPWLRINDAITFLSSIKPQLAFPTHDAILSREGKALADRLITGATPSGTRYLRIDTKQITV